MTIDAAEVARRVARCGDVARLTGGTGGVGTPVIGDRWIEGVRDLDPGVEVHVVARWGFTVDGLTTQVREAVAPMAFPVDVIIDDIDTPYDPPPEPPRPSSSPSERERAPSTDRAPDGEVPVVPVVVPVVAVAETLVVVVDSGGAPSAEPADRPTPE